MPIENERKRRNERLKMAAIPALAGILGAVLCWPDAATETVPALRDRKVEATIISRKSPLPFKSTTTADWPPVELSTLLMLDPFAAPPAAGPPQNRNANENSVSARPATAGDNVGTAAPSEDSTSEQTEAEMATKEIDYRDIGTLRAIVEGASGRLALIDDHQIVGEGDVIGEGLRIVKITASEVFVRALPQP